MASNTTDTRFRDSGEKVVCLPPNVPALLRRPAKHLAWTRSANANTSTSTESATIESYHRGLGHDYVTITSLRLWASHRQRGLGKRLRFCCKLAAGTKKRFCLLLVACDFVLLMCAEVHSISYFRMAFNPLDFVWLFLFCVNKSFFIITYSAGGIETSTKTPTRSPAVAATGAADLASTIGGGHGRANNPPDSIFCRTGPMASNTRLQPSLPRQRRRVVLPPPFCLCNEKSLLKRASSPAQACRIFSMNYMWLGLPKPIQVLRPSRHDLIDDPTVVIAYRNL